jgi:hypothetical protein
MRREITDFEWAAISSFLPNKPRGIPRVDDRRVLFRGAWKVRPATPLQRCECPQLVARDLTEVLEQIDSRSAPRQFMGIRESSCQV